MTSIHAEASPFLFVNIPQPGKNTRCKDVRTAVQKHVMRDIGKQRRGRPRPKGKKHDHTVSSSNCEVRADMAVRSTTLNARINPAVVVPAHMRSSAHFLIDHCTQSSNNATGAAF